MTTLNAYIPATSLFAHCYVIISHSLHKKAHFGRTLLPMFFLFMPVGPIAKAWDLGNAAEINDRITYTQYLLPLLLAEKLGQGWSVINKRSPFDKEIYC